MDLQSSKTLGGVGAILMLISPFLAVYSAVLGLVGLILVLIAVKGLADHYDEDNIFNNALYGILSTVAGGVIFVIAIIVTLVDFFRDVGLELAEAWTDPAVLSSIQFENLVALDSLMIHIGAILGSFVILFVFFVVAAIFYRKALNLIQEKTGVGLFGTTGLILLIGAILTIVLFGLLLIWVAILLLAIAFFSIKAEYSQPPPTTS